MGIRRWGDGAWEKLRLSVQGHAYYVMRAPLRFLEH